MKTAFQILIITAIASLLINELAFSQQAWTQKQGEGYFHVGTSFYTYSNAYDDSFGTITLPRPITEVSLSAYGEYGVTDKLTASISVPFHFISSGDLDSSWTGFIPPAGSISGLGHISAALTYNLYKNDGVVYSIKAGGSLNSAKNDTETGLRTGYNTYIISPRILAGYGSSSFFTSAETGIDLYGNGYLNRFIFNAQIGKNYTQSKRLTVIFALSANVALGNASDEDIVRLDGNATYTALYNNEQTFYAGTLKFGYKLTDPLTVWFTMGGGVAKNLGQNGVLSLSLGYKLN